MVELRLYPPGPAALFERVFFSRGTSPTSFPGLMPSPPDEASAGPAESTVATEQSQPNAEQTEELRKRVELKSRLLGMTNTTVLHKF